MQSDTDEKSKSVMPKWLSDKRDEFVLNERTTESNDCLNGWDACHAEMQKENDSLKDQLKWSLKNEEQYKKLLSGPTETAAKMAWRRVAELEDVTKRAVNLISKTVCCCKSEGGTVHPCERCKVVSDFEDIKLGEESI